MKRTLFSIIVLGLAVYWFVLRTTYYHPSSQERSDAGTTPWMTRGFTVAIVWPDRLEPTLTEGVTMAAEEVNAGGGPLAGKIHLRFVTETEDDRGDVARDLVKIPDLVAVIGHEFEGNAIPASVTYEHHGILFLSPKSTDVRLTEHGFQFVFRLTPDDTLVSEAVTDFAAIKKWQRFAVLHSRTDHGDLASAAFLSTAISAGLKVPVAQSFFNEPVWYLQDYRPMIAQIRLRSFDAIFLADQIPWAAKLLVDLASMGVTEPIVGTDKLDSPDLWQLAGAATNGFYVASAVDPESTDLRYLSFRDRFRKRFKSNPGYGAAQGYDAFMLFVAACLKSKDADPLVVATTLRTNKWTGLFGDVSFEPNGDVVGRKISIKRMQNGTFQSVFGSVELQKESNQ